jgi:signal transduction histidine kinase
MRQVQDATSAELAREVHDEIINVYVQLNIMSLQRLLMGSMSSDMRRELTLLLDNESRVNRSLRVVCERLRPTGLDDPMGLPGVLRGLTERVRVIWPGSCQLQLEGQQLPIEPAIQLELYRIAREALTNAVKHAEATTITIRLLYPSRQEEMLTLVIADDGRSGKSIQALSGHWGVRNMQESARAAGGELAFEQARGGGTSVVVTVHPSHNNRSEPPETVYLDRSRAPREGSPYASTD